MLVIGIDGLRPDALVAADTPAIDRLAAGGALALDASASAHTVSGPGWSTVLCGVWPDKHRATDNRFLITDYERYPSMFTLAKRARPDVRTAYFGNWGPIGERILAKDPIDVRLSLADPKVDGPTGDACVATLAGDAGIDLVFHYVGNVDETGHAAGFHAASPAYLAAIEAADAIVARDVAAIEARPSRADEDWLVIVVTDHGGTIDLNHGRDVPEHRRIPLLVSGEAAARGPLRGTANQCDVVATAFAHLGIAVDPAWDLDSRPVGLARDLAKDALFGRNLVFNGGAEAASPAPAPEVDRGIAGWKDLGAASSLAYGANADGPSATTPGPAQRGRAYFFGGDAAESRLEQRIDLSAAAKEIDAGSVPFELSAWLGGWARQRDVAWVELRFLDDRGGTTGGATLPAVSLEDRERAFGVEAPTGFLPRRTGAVVPAGTRVAEVVVRFERSEGRCDGCADEIALVLRPADAVLDAGPAVLDHGGGRATVWMRAGASAATTDEGRRLRLVWSQEKTRPTATAATREASNATSNATSNPTSKQTSNPISRETPGETTGETSNGRAEPRGSTGQDPSADRVATGSATTRGDGNAVERIVDAVAVADADDTVAFALEGVVAGAEIQYRIERAGDGAVLASGGFRALDPAAPMARIAFGSCADVDAGTALAWREIARRAPDALVLLGDTPYVDSTALATQRERHRAFASADDFERLVSATPFFATWDDHDMGKNDTDGRLKDKENARKVFLEYRPAPVYGDGTGGVYRSFRQGPIEVFILDARWFAKTEPSRDDPKQPSLLGEAQWRWLEAGLRASDAPFKVVASSMVWNDRVRALKPDCWGAYPHEYARFTRLLADTGATDAVLVAGDVHRSRVVVHPTGAAIGADLVELVTSPLHARVHADAAVDGPEVVFDAGIANAFLLLEAREDGTLVAQFVDATGRVFHERTVGRRDARPVR